MSRTIYILSVDYAAEGCKDFEYSDRQRAISEATQHQNNGAFSVRVYHHTNNGNNCIDDYSWEQP